MPYFSIKHLPENIQTNLPVHAQEILKDTFNNALEEYDNEQTAFKVAWSAVKKKYEKGPDGRWKLKS